MSTISAVYIFGKYVSDSGFIFLNSVFPFKILAIFGWIYTFTFFSLTTKKLLDHGELDSNKFKLVEDEENSEILE